MSEQRKRFLSITEAADLLGVNQKTLRAWADKGLIAHSRTPTGYRRFDPEEVATFQRAMKIEPVRRKERGAA